MSKNAEELFKRLSRLYDTWPSDGWDGAAQVIAAHAKIVEQVEKELALLHISSAQHGPKHPYYKEQCCCRTVPFSTPEEEQLGSSVSPISF